MRHYLYRRWRHRNFKGTVARNFKDEHSRLMVTCPYCGLWVGIAARLFKPLYGIAYRLKRFGGYKSLEWVPVDIPIQDQESLLSHMRQRAESLIEAIKAKEVELCQRKNLQLNPEVLRFPVSGVSARFASQTMASLSKSPKTLTLSVPDARLTLSSVGRKSTLR